MKKGIEKPLLKLREWVPWLVGAIAVLSADWAAEAISDTINIVLSTDPAIISPLRIFYIVFFIIMVGILYRQRKLFFRPHTRYLSNESPEPREHLILFLSYLKTDEEKYEDGVPYGLVLSNDLEKDIKAIEHHKNTHRPWPWEMALRGLIPHLKVLKSMTIVCSEKSITQVHWFVNICNRYQRIKDVEKHLLVQGHPSLIHASSDQRNEAQGWNFESFDELSRALWILLSKFKRRKYKEHETMIDFTGGQKVTSIVAATMTFNRQIKAQYVQTNPDWDVLSYDVILASSDTGELT